MPRILTLAQYQEIVASGADYSDCCGGVYETSGVYDKPAMMPDFEHPLPGGGYPLLNGFTVCRLCEAYCEDGPCRPDLVVTLQESTPSIANITTSAGDKDIDEWLERQSESEA